MNLEKLKDQARKFEQKEDWRRAIEVYLKAIDEFESGREPTPDLSLYNRIGDLYMKAGDSAAAVKSYERAVDLYADQGFYNNAIALCSKILRVQPGRMPVHLRLAYLHAHKNVLFEAKRHLVEYLERMNAAGQREDGIGAMAAFADQFDGNADVRMMLAELLNAVGREGEAVVQLRKAVRELEARGDEDGASQARARLAELDPGGDDEPSGSVADAAPPADIVFMDAGAALMGADDVDTEEIDGLTVERSDEGFALEPSDVDAVPDLDSAAVAVPAEERDEVEPLDGLVIDGSGLLDASADGASVTPPDFELETASEPLEFDVISAAVEGLDAGDPSALGIEGLERSEDTEFAPPDAGALETSDELLDLPPISLAADLGPATSADEIDLPAEPLDFDLVGGEEIVAGRHPEPSDAEPLVDSDPPVDLPFIDVGSSTGEDAIAALEDRVLEDPSDPVPHAELGRALAELGHDRRAVEELELAVMRFEDRGDIADALDATGVILGVTPDEVRYHQKAVELAFRLGDRTRLLAAYQGLGEALARAGESDKAAAVFRRVLEQEPSNRAAQAELDRLGAAAASAAPPAPAAAPPAAAAPGDFVDLGSLVLEAEGPRDTRMRMEGHEEPPTSGDEQRDFDEMLDAFKRGIEENLGEDDHEAHYDLGVAFKEMGLLEEAIGEFQKALRGADGRLRTAEALGQCFFEKGQYGIAETVLRRGLDEPGGDDAKIGLIYWLGRACEAQGKRSEAAASYERALAVDIRFMDLSERVQRLTAERGA